MGVKMNEYGVYIIYLPQTCKNNYYGRYVGKRDKKFVIFKLWKWDFFNTFGFNINETL